MTNEELAVSIAQGREDLQLRLWEQVRAFVRMKARKTITLSGGAGGVTLDDLEQAGYLAMLRAVEKYDPARGSFLSCLSYALQQEFASAGGYRSTKRDPLDSSLSLDAPVQGGEDDGDALTYADTLEDPQDVYAEVERACYTEQLHEALDDAIERLPPLRADIMRAHFWDGESRVSIAAERGISPQYASRCIHGALADLRRGRAGRELRRFLEEENLYSGVGLTRFNTTQTSAVEAVVLRLEERMEREQDARKAGAEES